MIATIRVFIDANKDSIPQYITWTLKLKAGKHTVRSDAHKKLRRTFMVTPAT